MSFRRFLSHTARLDLWSNTVVRVQVSLFSKKKLLLVSSNLRICFKKSQKLLKRWTNDSLQNDVLKVISDLCFHSAYLLWSYWYSFWIESIKTYWFEISWLISIEPKYLRRSWVSAVGGLQLLQSSHLWQPGLKFIVSFKARDGA